ncbi:protein argonaute 2-like [Tripterygium wilfordii]|uniref:Protein argonaute 2-like n=1 Tax=Tripterygium wilfordii TaxID=458696 RepID=A0A7J7D7T0_TRIWF|nr:protein argonaute 2-like [Tripterygium wilfordii]KAF5742348.1 protein argonaute 2-like [Tripterygium wilfordii]
MERGGFRGRGSAFGGDGRGRGRNYGQSQQQEQYHQQGRGRSQGRTQGHVGPSQGGRGGAEGPRSGGYYGGRGGGGRGGGEGRGYWGPPAPGQPHSQRSTAPVMRPDSGSTNAVRSLRLRTNHFLVKYNQESIIRHYNVDVKQEVPSKPGQRVKLPKSILSKIRNKLSSDDPIRFPLSMTAYDGEKSIFSAVALPTGKFKVEFSHGESMRTRSFIVTLQLANEIKLCKLNDYLSGTSTSIPRDILQPLDVVMKENPTRKMISFRGTFHSPTSYPKDSIGRGITASKGVKHRLKLSSQGLALCLDYSVLPFWEKIPVIDFLEKQIRGFDVNNFKRFMRDVENNLKGLKVNVTHRATDQVFKISGLTKDITQNISFPLEDPNGVIPPRDVRLVDYFMEKYSKDIVCKNIPCLNLGKSSGRNYVPMEFCVIAGGQRCKKELLDKYQDKKLKEKSLVRPKDRLNTILDMIQDGNGPRGGDISKNFGIEVDTNMTTVTARVIKPPELKLRTQNGNFMKVTVDGEKCHWNLVRKYVVEGKQILRWGLLDLSSYDRDELDADNFIPKLLRRCNDLGIDMAEPVSYRRASMNLLYNVDGLQQMLKGINEESNEIGRGDLEILVCVMPREDPGYNNLKWISEKQVGIVTQSCLSTNANKANDQFLANLALKINAKNGGSNVELMNLLPRIRGNGHVMFIGADVNHPGSWNSTSPSIAAVVSTVNWPAANRYIARIQPQDHRAERILNFGHMCLELVDTYAQLNQTRPEKIIIFRDGVSENQFDMVLEEELGDLKRKFKALNYSPTITVIVAQKRHLTRLFPENDMDGGSTGNVPPGTVVDTKINRDMKTDFYLSSHYGNIGTSKPAHYHALWDEHNFTRDELQELCYSLCFTCAQCTKPVSVVPPVWYADRAAYRGRLYHDAIELRKSSSSSSSSASAEASEATSSAVASFDEQLYRLHPNVENSMFFL